MCIESVSPHFEGSSDGDVEVDESLDDVVTYVVEVELHPRDARLLLLQASQLSHV